MARWLRNGLGLVFAVVALSACHANGPTFTVDTLTDSADLLPGDGLCADNAGDCSLRAAVQEANALPGVDTIALVDGATYTLTIAGAGEDLGATGDLDFTEGVVVSGNATIDANGLDRALHMHHSGGLVEFDGPDVTGGVAPDGAAFAADGAGLVSFLDASISGNTASAGAPIRIAAGVTWLWDSVVHANTGTTAGGVEVSGGVLSMENTTLTGSIGAPAVAVTGGAATIVHGTVTANLAGGFEQTTGSLSVGSSIVADQVGGTDCSGAITSTGNNLESATTCGFSSAGDLQNTTPGIGPLADNGGPTLTHAPTAGSAAINAAAPSGCTFANADARGLIRPAGASCDIGAVEVQPSGNCSSLAIGPGADLAYCDLSGMFLVLRDMNGANLTGADLSDALLIAANLSNTTLDGARLDRAILTDATIAGATTLGATFNGTVLYRTNVTATDFSGADLTGIAAAEITTTPAALPAGWAFVTGIFAGPGVDLTGVDLSGVDVTGVDFTGTILTNASIAGANVTGADFSGATIDGLTTGGLVGVPAALPPGIDLVGGFFIGPGVIMDGVDLTGVDFSGRDLTGAVFRNLSLDNANLAGANLTDVDFETVTLNGTDLTATTTTRTFSAGVTGVLAGPSHFQIAGGRLWAPQVDLRAPGFNYFVGFTVAGADITGAVLDGATFNNVTFDGVTATGLSISEADLNGWHVTGSDITGADVTDSHLFGGYTFDTSTLTNVDFTGVRFEAGVFSNSSIDGAIFATLVEWDISTGYLITGVPVVLDPAMLYVGGFLLEANGTSVVTPVVPGGVFTNLTLPARFVDASASGTDWSGSTIDALEGGDYSGADFTGARIGRLRDVDITGANLAELDLRDLESRGLIGAPTAIPAHAQLAAGVLFHAWGELVPSSAPTDLAALDLSYVDLTAGDYSGRPFANQEVSYANTLLIGADLRGADLRDADFTNANLAGARIEGALFGTNVSGATVWNNTTCPDGTNTDTNGGTCVGHDWPDRYDIVVDPGGSATDLSGHAITLGQSLVVPTLTFVSGETVVDGPSAGVDWYIDGVLYRDDDHDGPFQLAGNNSLPTDVTFNGQAGGAGNSFNLGIGVHTIRAEAMTTGGLRVYSATFRIDEA